MNEIDAYLAELSEPERRTLAKLRADIHALIPEVEEGFSYGMPAFKVGGKPVAGFAAFKHHLSYFPHSGSVVAELADDLAGYDTTKSSVHFSVDKPLPRPLVRKLIQAKMALLPAP